MLGFVSGLCGPNAVAATTVAVEQVVLRHLKNQMEYLSQHDEIAFDIVSSIIEEEAAHRDRAASAVDEKSFWLAVFTPIVAASTEAVIWVGMHL